MKGINIYIKIFVFCLLVAGISFGVSAIFSGSPQLNFAFGLGAQCVLALAVVDITVFFYSLIIKTEKLKPLWKAYIMLLVAMTAFPLLGVIFYNYTLVYSILMFMSPLMFVLSVVDLIIIEFYALFGSDKLTIWWKMFIFMMIISATALTLYFIMSMLGYLQLALILQIIAYVSFVFAMTCLCVIIFQKLFASEKMSVFIKLFIFLLIVAAILFALAFIMPWGGVLQSAMFIAASAVFVAAVLDLFVVLFRKIFMDK